jgi:hypothetical protein
MPRTTHFDSFEFDRMIHALWTFPLRFASLAGANETLAAQRDHAQVAFPLAHPGTSKP